MHDNLPADASAEFGTHKMYLSNVNEDRPNNLNNDRPRRHSDSLQAPHQTALQHSTSENFCICTEVWGRCKWVGHLIGAKVAVAKIHQIHCDAVSQHTYNVVARLVQRMYLGLACSSFAAAEYPLTVQLHPS
jgi:hypothetical protein